MKPSFFPVLILVMALAGLTWGVFQVWEDKGAEQPKVERFHSGATQQRAEPEKLTDSSRTSTSSHSTVAVVEPPSNKPPKKAVVPLTPERREALKSVSPRVSALWKNEKGEEPTFDQKKMIIHELGSNLSAVEREALYDYLRSGPSDDVYDLAVIDRLMIHLENIPEIAPEFVSTLIDLSKDAKVDGSVRGYVIQHLEDAYQAKSGLRGDIEEALYGGLGDTSTDVSGTSVQVLTSLSYQFPHLDQKRIALAALSLAGTDNTFHTSRITAISAVGNLGIKEALPVVRKQAEEGDRTVMKLAAIHSLGQLGEQKDIPFLEEILANPEKKLFAKAAQKALDRLKKNSI